MDLKIKNSYLDNIYLRNRFVHFLDPIVNRLDSSMV